MDINTRVVPSVELSIPLPASSVGASSAEISGSDIVNAIESAGAGTAPDTAPNEWTSSKGLKLQLYKVNRMVVAEGGQNIKMPDVPKTWNPDQERYEDNPNDPDYQAAHQRATMRQGIAAVNIYLALGTKILAPLPSGLVEPQEDSWSADLAELEVFVPTVTQARARYCAWLRLYALTDGEFGDLSSAVMRYSGHVSERQVSEITEAFRSDGTGQPDNVSTFTPKN